MTSPEKASDQATLGLPSQLAWPPSLDSRLSPQTGTGSPGLCIPFVGPCGQLCAFAALALGYEFGNQGSHSHLLLCFSMLSCSCQGIISVTSPSCWGEREFGTGAAVGSEPRYAESRLSCFCLLCPVPSSWTRCQFLFCDLRLMLHIGVECSVQGHFC